MQQLLKELEAILADMNEYRREHDAWLINIAENQQAAADNLLDYLAFRQLDRRDLQSRLNSCGLSSLARSEMSIREQIYRVAAVIKALLGQEPTTTARWAEFLHTRDQRLLSARAEELFGPFAHRRTARIMVTMPSQAAWDRDLIQRLIHSGMDIARINCAHDGAVIWLSIARNVREVAAAEGKNCQIQFDLAGPKLRTGPMPPGPHVIKVKPEKNLRGQVETPCAMTFYCPTDEDIPTDAGHIPVQCDSFMAFGHIDRLNWRDARGKKRSARVVEQNEHELRVELDATSYFESGMIIEAYGEVGRIAFQLADLPAIENYLALAKDDLLKLVADGRIASPAIVDEQEIIIEPATLSCASPEVISRLQVGETVKLDDGKFSGQIIATETDSILLQITHAPPGGGKLKAEKGVNFPNSDLGLAGFTQEDFNDLQDVAAAADLIALSFVNQGSDILALQNALDDLHANHIGIILKIETRQAYDHLAELLLTAMRSQKVGVMIARGDLSVELGWQDIAQAQEELLRLCAAAHLPVIWATQVLETLAKSGNPTRSEITDAAMAQRSECIMLNKGPFIEDAVTMLNAITKGMDHRQTKWQPLLPPLALSPLPATAPQITSDG